MINFKDFYQQITEMKCWSGYKKDGYKTIKKNGKKKRVNNCVKK